jgi:hypothetical protein
VQAGLISADEPFFGHWNGVVYEARFAGENNLRLTGSPQLTGTRQGWPSESVGPNSTGGGFGAFYAAIEGFPSATSVPRSSRVEISRSRRLTDPRGWISTVGPTTRATWSLTKPLLLARSGSP